MQRMSEPQPSLLEAAGRRIAYHHHPGRTPGVLFLGGFMSDMNGTKATALEHWCVARGIAYTRFDYSGHGASSGSFEAGTIGAWLEDALAVFERITQGAQILVGSSMGGWIALLVARQRPGRVAALLTLACATDFTEQLLRPALSDRQRNELAREGVTELSTPYRESPYRICTDLLEEGHRHLLLDAQIAIDAPLRMLHGDRDEAVPLSISRRTLERYRGADTELVVVEGGGHRLSTPRQLALTGRCLEELLSKISAEA